MTVPTCVTEVDPDGNIVFQWFVSDHFEEIGFSDFAKDAIFQAGGDIMHSNSARAIPVDIVYEQGKEVLGL